MTRYSHLRPVRAALTIGGVLAVAIGGSGARAQSSFTEIPYTLSNGSNLDLYDASRPTSDGSQIVGTEFTTDPSGNVLTSAQAVVITGSSSTPTQLGFLPGDSFSYGYGISADGSTEVGASVGSTVQAVTWTSGTATSLGSLSGYDQSVAYGASSNGGVVTGVATNSTTNDSQVFRWTAGGGMTNLGPLPGGYTDTSLSLAYGNTISADGSAIAGDLSSATGAQPTQSFLWTSGGVQALGVQSGGTYSITAAISSDGSTVVGYGNDANGKQQAYKWTAATGMVGLGYAYGSFQTTANSASASTSLIVGDYFHLNASGVMDYESAYVYSAAYGYADLADYVDQLPGMSSALAGWTSLDAYDVSADGTTIIGDGVDPQGNYAYFTVVDQQGFTQPYTESQQLANILGQYTGSTELTPEPATIALLPAGLALVGGVIRRRRC